MPRIFTIIYICNFIQVNRKPFDLKVRNIGIYYYTSLIISSHKPLQRYTCSTCVMTLGEFYPLLAMLLSHVMVHTPILSPFLFRQSLYSLLLNQRIFKIICLLLFLLPEAISYCLQRGNIVAPAVMVSDTLTHVYQFLV